MKDLLPPTLVTFIKDVLQAIIANELHARMMKSYVVPFRCRQSVTDLAHINSQIHRAHVAWVSRFPVSWHGVGHGLYAKSKMVMHWDTQHKSSKVYIASKKSCWWSTRLWDTRKGWCKTNFHALRVALVVTITNPSAEEPARVASTALTILLQSSSQDKTSHGGRDDGISKI